MEKGVTAKTQFCYGVIIVTTPRPLDGGACYGVTAMEEMTWQQ